jgi:vacuolar-type H+-ATPase subunit D/Vma8
VFTDTEQGDKVMSMQRNHVAMYFYNLCKNIKLYERTLEQNIFIFESSAYYISYPQNNRFFQTQNFTL